MLLYRRPHQTRQKEADDPDHKIPRTLAQLLGAPNQEPLKPFEKFLAFGTHAGLISCMQWELPKYFQPLGPMLEELRLAIFGNDHNDDMDNFLCHPPRITHKRFRDILGSWMKKIQTDPALKELRKVDEAPKDCPYPPVKADGTWTAAPDSQLPLRNNTDFVVCTGLAPGINSVSTSACQQPTTSCWPRVPQPQPSRKRGTRNNSRKTSHKLAKTKLHHIALKRRVLLTTKEVNVWKGRMEQIVALKPTAYQMEVDPCVQPEC